jgi:hypothetical protein
LDALLAVVYIAPFAKVAANRQGGAIVRGLGIVVLMLAGGCSVWPFGKDTGGIPSEAVRSYADAHGLSREEARRELLMFRDADQLRQSRTKKDDAVTTP